MRKVIILCLVVLCASQAMATNDKFQAKLTSLLNMKSKAVDAVDSALGLLRDLKQANFDAQKLADQHNATIEEQDGKLIKDLTSIADSNKATGDAATANRKHIENEIQVTAEYLAWINNRRTDIKKKREALREQRCYANFMFIKSLKEHQEAIEVVKFLREDIAGIVAEANHSSASLSQIKDSVSKLQAYAHLFNDQAMKEFAQLTAPEAVDPKTAEWNAQADDNNKGELQLQHMGAGTQERNIGQKFLDLIDKLDAQLKQAIVDLEANEIKAAWDLIAWLTDSEKELEHLDVEQAAKTTYQDKLLIAIVAAKAHEDGAWEIYFESAATLNNAVEELNVKRQAYAAEKGRRDEENRLLDEVIQMFIDRVSSLDKGMRTKVDDFTADGAFDNSNLHRRTNDAYAKDNGKLDQNVAAEAAHAAF